MTAPAFPRKYVFGPIASRRLGRSLGVDLVPPKTCPLDCIYCEAKKTTLHTMERKEYVPIDEVLQELDRTLAPGPELHYITFSGAGEPTLNSGIGRVVRHLKKNYPQYRICLLTNGALLGDRALREEIAPVDLVVPNLDGSNEEEFQRVDKPVPGLSFARFAADLTDFIRTARQTVHLELFIAPGINDSDASIARFARLIGEMRPALVQLNTLDRPGTDPTLRPSTPENTRRFIRVLEKICPVEAVGPFRYRTPSGGKQEYCEEERNILNLILRAPATAAEMAAALALPETEVTERLEALLDAGLVTATKKDGLVLYQAE